MLKAQPLWTDNSIMKFFRSLSHKSGLTALLILAVCLMPLLGMGKHVHLAETHMGAELHSHHAESHGFHMHGSQHDNIDIDESHPSDSQEVALDVDIRVMQLAKLIALVCLAIVFHLRFVKTSPVIRPDYSPPIKNIYEIFSALLRGPPASILH